MSQFNVENELPDFDILEQAASWFAHLESAEATEEDHQRLKAWLSESPAHQRAWRYVEKISQRFSIIHQENQVNNTSNTLSKLQQHTLGRRALLRSLLFAAIVGGTGLVSWQYPPLSSMARAMRADFRTGIGEQKDIVLADGSHIWLNTDTAINIDYNKQQRHIELVQGEILIETAPDRQQRSFWVSSQQGQMQALGTRFNVYQQATETQLTVYEGRVAVKTKTQQHILAAGKQATFADTGELRLSNANIQQSAWITGVIVADQMTLAELVDQLGRYHRGHIGVSPDVATLAVVGSFPTQDQARVLSMLTASLPIKVRSLSPWWVSIVPAN
ncbi:MAG TPA: FecR family protein [Methylophaga aminisulfidivorans]|uniref:FecR family protein n=1 Tax=Methylophaga TaxID=40222 RepID=UPI00176B44B9|nr:MULTISPECIES: FecR family protein [Methylophaga]HIC47140.1 FecR family protein [Methylophaga sp.]HIM38998.1 FecR family protein [Methylophaga aminisulfidivorans]